MGIINVTPDSFSDGGEAFVPDDAIKRGLTMIEQGAHILDVGGESTRPGADVVSQDEEKARIEPVVRALAQTGIVVSIDTRHASVMEAAIDAGATIVNDVTALQGDTRSLDVVAGTGVSLVLMHMQGDPQTMQADPHYHDVVADVRDYLESRVMECEAAGMERHQIAIDPGIGFGKTTEHNLVLMKHLSEFTGRGCPVMLGVSRKSFIARISDNEPPKQRLAGSLAAGLAGLVNGVSILRVHDVAETRQAISVWQAISSAGIL
jgi:dihydropteroate synthase